MLTAFAGAFFFLHSAQAACLEKKPVGAAKLVAAANDADKKLFLDRGFQEVVCPAGLNLTQESVNATCGKLAAYSSEAKATFRRIYGVSTDEFCTAAQAYVAAQ